MTDESDTDEDFRTLERSYFAISASEREEYIVKLLHSVASFTSILKDKMNRIQEKHDVLSDKVDVLSDKVDALQKTQLTLQQKLDSILEHLSKRSTDLNELQNLAADVGQDKRP